MPFTGSYEDVKKAYFKSQQTALVETATLKYTSDDFEQAAFSQKASLPITTEVTTAKRRYLNSQGLASYANQNLTDMWMEWLRTKGYTQANLTDREYAFFTAGSVNL